MLLHPDEGVRSAISAVFERFAACGLACQVWLWLRENGLRLPAARDGQVTWATTTYPAVHKVLTHRTALLVLPWKGGLLGETTADLPGPKPPYRTSEDTISLIGRLAAHYDDSMLAKILNVAAIRGRNGIPPPRTEQATTRTAKS